MKAKEAEQLLPCFRPADGQDITEPRIEKAIRIAERDEGLKAKLNAQIAFDQQVVNRVEAIEIPPRLAEKLGMIEGGVPPNIWTASPLKNPAVLAAVLSLLVVAALLVRGAMERAENFHGKEVVIQMVEAAQGLSGVEFEPINPTELGKLNDWFAMNGMDRFDPPPEFANLKAVGCRVFKQSGFSVAQALVEDNHMIINLFRGADLGVKLDSAEKWRIFTANEWIAAVRALDDMCFLIAFRGNEQEMQELLKSRTEK